MNKNKRIHYRHVHALRDLSSCFNFAGVKIKKGVFYRSAYLGKLSAIQAKEFVEYFNIGYVIDLRTSAEKEAQPDLHADLVQYYHIPIIDEFDNPLITKENRNGILLDISKIRTSLLMIFCRLHLKGLPFKETVLSKRSHSNVNPPSCAMPFPTLLAIMAIGKGTSFCFNSVWE